jgi:hypothetical protein
VKESEKMMPTMCPIHFNGLPLADRTQVALERSGQTLVNATFPRRSSPLLLVALREIHRTGGSLEGVLDVAQRVSAWAPSWWEFLSGPYAMPLEGTYYDCSLAIEDNQDLSGFGGEVQP